MFVAEIITIFLAIVTFLLSIVLVADKKLYGITLFNYLYYRLINRIEFLLFLFILSIGFLVGYILGRSLLGGIKFINLFSEILSIGFTLSTIMIITCLFKQIISFFKEIQGLKSNRKWIIETMLYMIFSDDENIYHINNRVLKFLASDFISNSTTKIDIILLKEIKEAASLKLLIQTEQSYEFLIGFHHDFLFSWINQLFIVKRKNDIVQLIEILKSYERMKDKDIDSLENIFFLSLTHVFIELEILNGDKTINNLYQKIMKEIYSDKVKWYLMMVYGYLLAVSLLPLCNRFKKVNINDFLREANNQFSPELRNISESEKHEFIKSNSFFILKDYCFFICHYYNVNLSTENIHILFNEIEKISADDFSLMHQSLRSCIKNY